MFLYLSLVAVALAPEEKWVDGMESIVVAAEVVAV